MVVVLPQILVVVPELVDKVMRVVVGLIQQLRQQAEVAVLEQRDQTLQMG